MEAQSLFSGSMASEEMVRRFKLCSNLLSDKRATITEEGMVRPTGFEPVAPRLGIWCSIRLSYGRPYKVRTIVAYSMLRNEMINSVDANENQGCLQRLPPEAV